MEIYTSGQALYKELTARGPEIRPNVPDHYGVAAPPLVHAALASCAEGEQNLPCSRSLAAFLI